MTKWSHSVGAPLLELPHHETAPAAPPMGTPLLNHRGKEDAKQRSRMEEKSKGGWGGQEDRHGEGEEIEQEGWGEERETTVD